MKKFELVFIPMPGMGHLVSTVEMANILLTRNPRLAITLLAIKSPFDSKASHYIQSLSASVSTNSLRFIVLPEPPPRQEQSEDFVLKEALVSYKLQVREAVAKLTESSQTQLVGFVLDMFCMAMIDVAKEFEVPCYAFYTSGAGYLDFSLHLQELYSQNNSNEVVQQLQNSDVELGLLSFVNPVPSKLIPGIFSFEKAAVWLHEQAKRLRSEIKGVLVNTFVEMEPHVLNSMSSRSASQPIPLLYPVGPILQLKKVDSDGSSADVLKWLDDQPRSSVVFLCFGSRGSFGKDQVEEIALALERSGLRFVWSLRRPPPEGTIEAPSDYATFEDVLPKGFLDRTSEVGRVIGWAPQVEILAHPATGGFVSHCGWNSTLESMWYGVPMATWPMYAEQMFNAFELVVELGLAVEITIDYHNDFCKEKARIVSAEEIESGIKRLMDEDNEIRKKVKAKSEECRKAILEGGSSFVSLGHFIDDVLANSPRGE
ncbi:anthocyanidin 3-O-glucosyltransferase 2-like [Momordica charantia]|uniref:Glycosyltransferase n=1 Tax=Momordica charantia TaxID=3673 RepID=A0A6J1DJL2_MOMCH|nr:anthocyanidin 3-O-glucosyltransferase 2-like [Momordica charantia]